MTKVKTCGLKTTAEVAAARDDGADYLGFIHFPPSPRHLALDAIARLSALKGPTAKGVLVVVDDAADLVDAWDLKSLNVDFLQLHGKETLAQTADIAAKSPVPLIKAISVRSAEDVDAAQDYLPHVHALLFDAKPPADGDWLPGGNGLSFDWTILNQSWLKQQFWFLSGGLTAQNVAQAIALTGAPAVDVSSGIERTPGEKDDAEIRAFLSAAKGSADIASA